MTTNELLMLLAGIAVSCGILALLLVIYPRLRAGTGPVLQASVESLLQPVVYQAIISAYRLSEKSVDQGYERLKGANKKVLADSVYRLLPDRIGEYDIALVKALVPPERFQVLVQNCFDQFDRFYIVHHQHFDDEFRTWVAAHSAAAPSPPQPAAPAT